MVKSSAKRRGVTHPGPAGPSAESATRIAVPPANSVGQPEAAAPRRRFRGAAPWAARHAAKRAAEAEARNKEPPKPGSARATLRAPEEAERIKARIGALHQALARIRAFKKHLPQHFFEVGAVLQEIRNQRLFDAKGYSSFESFVDREVDLGSKTLALRLARIPDLFREEGAKALGLEPVLAALEAIEQAVQRAQRAPTGSPTPRGR